MEELYDKLLCSPVAGNFRYGTSGFRDLAETLLPIVPRVALVTALRCVFVNDKETASLACGIMVTASHNPIQDNGLKIVDVTGSMLPIEWEAICTNIVNAKSRDELQGAVNSAVPGL